MSTLPDDAKSGVAFTPSVTRYALVMLTIAYAFNFIDRQILVILQQSIKEEMALLDWQLGLLTGPAFAAIYVTAGIPVAYWADRANRKNIISLAVAVWSGMTVLSGTANSFWQLFAARFGVGLGEAGGSPPAHAMISDYYPPEERGAALGFYSAGLHFGIVLGFLIGAFVEQAFGWRYAFMVVGAPGMIFAGIFFLTVKEPPRGRFESASSAAQVPTLGETIAVLRGFRSFWLIAVACGLTAFGGYGVGNFLPAFVERSHGISGWDLGVVMAFGGGGAGMLGTFLGGRLADRLGSGEQRWYLWLPAAASTLALPLVFPMLLADATPLAIGSMVMVTALTNTYLGPSLATCHQLVPPAMRALTSAILFFILNLIGLGCGPPFAGALSDVLGEAYGTDGLRYALQIVAAISAVGVGFFVLAARQLPKDLARSEG